MYIYIHISLLHIYIYTHTHFCTHVCCRVQELGFREIRGPLGGCKGSSWMYGWD